MVSSFSIQMNGPDDHLRGNVAWRSPIFEIPKFGYRALMLGLVHGVPPQPRDVGRLDFQIEHYPSSIAECAMEV